MYLPDKFLDQMQALLGEEYQAFLESYEEERRYGLRVNTGKITCEEFERISPFTLEKIPWIPNGYFYEGSEQPGKHPFYNAGLYYLQEPSAMTPASRLEIQPGDSVLDLCAAPGGKATELGVKLQGQGVLVANDISNSRAMALLKNITLFGITNPFVVNEPPEKLLQFFEGFFDKILLDAPCSGEGMFRKEPSSVKSWEAKGVDYYARIQKEIILPTAKMLKPGGKLLYSTCTFAPQEDEEIIRYLLEQSDEFTLIDIEGYEGFDSGHPEWVNGPQELEKCVRIWPHKMQGEGHFMALLQRKGEPGPNKQRTHAEGRPKNVDTSYLEEFFINISMPMDWERVEIQGDKVYYMPDNLGHIRGMRFLRNGLFLGEMKKKRFEPSQSLAMALNAEEYDSVLSFSVLDERVIRYLKGETIEVMDLQPRRSTGWQLICVQGYPLGWGKLINGVLRNKYKPGWRWL